MSPSRIGILGQHGNPYWKPWVISSVGIICAFILLFSWYMILRRLSCTLGSARFLRNPNQRRTLPNDANPDDPSLQFHSHGLDFSVVQSLPITQFKKKNEAGQTQSNTDCAVCLGEFEEGEWLRHLPNCTHAFHTCCIDSWFVAHSNCPLCRSEVYDFGMDHDHECPVPMHTPLETLRESHYQIIRSAILGTSPLGREARQAI